MLNPLLLLAPIIAFITTFLLTKRWIPVAFRVGLVGKDMNKLTQPAVAEMGGIALVGGIIGGMLFYISLNTFVLNQSVYNLDLFATLSTILIIAFVGLIDDLLGWKIGLSQLQKPLLTIPAALPMMVVNAGHSSIALPLVGSLSLGLIFPLLFIPIGVVGASNGFNMLAGYNGLEAGMGVIILGTMGILAYLTGSSWVAMIALVTVTALLAFLFFNWYPSKIFPGNAFTYMVGAIIACVAILGNLEKLALILFIPYYLDFLLPLRAKFKTEAFAKVNADGSLELPYHGIYDVTHLMLAVVKKIKHRVFETDVVLSIFAIEIILALVGSALYWPFHL
jgi:UDP-N-acetylglucosamine--dolichyl-phosphate N-acetylglucosaminephosphotransferase